MKTKNPAIPDTIYRVQKYWRELRGELEKITFEDKDNKDAIGFTNSELSLVKSGTLLLCLRRSVKLSSSTSRVYERR